MTAAVRGIRSNSLSAWDLSTNLFRRPPPYGDRQVVSGRPEIDLRATAPVAGYARPGRKREKLVLHDRINPEIGKNIERVCRKPFPHLPGVEGKVLSTEEVAEWAYEFKPRPP